MEELSINLGHHVASIDKATGELSISDQGSSVRLPADEAYRLIAWLRDERHDRLYEKFHDSLRDASEKRFDAGNDAAAI